jgi:hypothetical protein
MAAAVYQAEDGSYPAMEELLAFQICPHLGGPGIKSLKPRKESGSSVNVPDPLQNTTDYINMR